jgi:hypothetical protein
MSPLTLLNLARVVELPLLHLSRQCSQVAAFAGVILLLRPSDRLDMMVQLAQHRAESLGSHCSPDVSDDQCSVTKRHMSPQCSTMERSMLEFGKKGS